MSDREDYPISVVHARFVARVPTLKDAEAIRDMVQENERLRAGLLTDASPVGPVTEGMSFKGDDRQLVNCIEALLDLDSKGALVPHGVGGHARSLLQAASERLSAGLLTEDKPREADALKMAVEALEFYSDADGYIVEMLPKYGADLPETTLRWIAEDAGEVARTVLAAIRSAEG